LQENIGKIEKAYDAFLGEFPLCYGYWKKYTDHEAKLGSPEKIVDVYERAVKSVTYSVDIWMHYSAYAMDKFNNPEMTRRCVGISCFYSSLDVLILSGRETKAILDLDVLLISSIITLIDVCVFLTCVWSCCSFSSCT